MIDTRKRMRHPYLVVALLCLLVGLVSLMPEMVLNNGVFYSRTDYVEQQVPFILETKRMFESGTPFWSWNSLFGDNFIGSYSFYTVGSPFVWMILWLPEHWIPTGMTFAILVKFMTAGVTSFAFLRRFVKKDVSAVIGALLYTFSSFTVINTQFNHFMDVIAVFPLILLGLEMMFSKRESRRRGVGFFSFAVFLNAMVNYYFFVGTMIFAALYFVFRLFLSGDWERKKASLYGRLALEGGLGVGMAMFLLLPSLLKMLSTPKATTNLGSQFLNTIPFNQYLERVRVLFMPIESLSRHAFFNNAASYASVAAYLAVFGGVLALVFCITQWKRSWLAKFLPFLVLISLLPGLNAAFALFSDNAYTRWWYALVLMLALATVLTLEKLPELNPKIPLRVFWGVVIGLAALLLPYVLAYTAYRLDWFPNWAYFQKLTQYYSQEYFNVGGYRTMAFSLALTGMNYLALWAVLKKMPPKKLLVVLVAACCAMNYAGFNAFNNTTRSKGYEHESYGPDAIPIRYHLDVVTDRRRPTSVGKDTYRYRVDFPTQFLRNYGMYNNEPGVGVFHSVRNASSAEFIEFAKYIGSYKSSVYTFPLYQNREYLDTFLSVKQYKNYAPEKEPNIPWEFVKTETVAGTDIYENPNYLPMGFTYDSYITRSELTAADHPNSNVAVRNFLNTLVLEDADVSKFSGLLSHGTAGAREADFPALKEMADARRAESCDEFEGTSAGFTAHIKLSRKNLVFFSVPYDEGFTATVNGKEAEIIKCNLGFSAVVCDAGESDIVFTYHTPGLKAGVCVTAGSALLLGGYLLVERSRAKRESV